MLQIDPKRGGKDPATGERQEMNRKVVQPHQVGGPCRRCTVATYDLPTSEMSGSSENLGVTLAPFQRQLFVKV